MANCPECGTEVGAGQRFCGQCGARQPEGCASCGAPLQPGQRFCGQCGAPVAGAAHPPTAAPAPASNAAEVRLVSVLFVDLVGFTSLSETRDAEDMRELLSNYFAVARQVVGRHGGTIEKFIGDAVMAVWGTPVAHEDDAARAVRAGLELVAEIRSFADRVGAPQLQARGGIVTGRAASWASTAEGLVVGDRVNTASRVQSVAEPGTVLVEGLTREATDYAFDYREAGSFQVKGKAEPIQLWQAVPRSGEREERRGPAEPSTTIGREAELERLEQLFDASAERSEAAMVVISGPAGVGKTRVLLELEERLRRTRRPVLWHEVGCTSYGSEVAYYALSRIVRQRLGVRDEDSPELVSEKLQRGLLRYLPEAADREFAAPKLAVLLGLPGPEPTPSRDEFFAAWRGFLEGLARIRPLVLAIDNLQWADSGLLDFLEHLIEVSSGLPLLVIGLCRPELLNRREGWTQRRGFSLVPIDRLQDEEIESLLQELVPAMPRASRGRVADRAEGIPLYAVETVHMLVGRGLVVERDGVRTLTQELTALETPVSLEALIAARLDELAAPERSLVKDLAVLGLSFSRDAVAALSPEDPGRLDQLLLSLQRQGVLSPGSDGKDMASHGFSFSQTLLRAVAYDRLGKRERRARHLAVAAHLRDVFESGADDVSESVAAHYRDAYATDRNAPDAAEVGTQARQWLARAAQRAAAVGAPERAASDLLQAAELSPDEEEALGHREGAASMYFRAGLMAESLENFEMVAVAYREAGRELDAARLEGEIGSALGRLGRAGEATVRLREALAVLEGAAAGPALAQVCSQLGRELSIAGEVEEATPVVERALQLAEQLDLPQVLCDALETKALLVRSSGQSLEALELFERTISIAAERGLTTEELSGHANSADIRIANDLPGAVAHLEAAIAMTRRLGQRYNETFLSGNLMLAQVFSGEWAEAEAVARGLLQEERHGQEIVHSRLLLIRALRGEGAAAREELGHLGRWEHHDSKEPRTLRVALEGTVLLAEGQLEAALECSRAALEQAMPSFGLRHEITRQAWPDACEAALRLGRGAVLAGLLDLLQATPPEGLPPYLEAQLLRFRGLSLGAGAESAELLAQAGERFSDLHYPYWGARTLREWAASAPADGPPPERLQEAAAELARLGAAEAR